MTVAPSANPRGNAICGVDMWVSAILTGAATCWKVAPMGASSLESCATA